MPIDVTVPQLGESVTEATLTKWLVKEGDVVVKDQPLAGLAPSPEGRRLAVLRQDGLLQLLPIDGVERLGSPANDLAALLGRYRFQPEGEDLVRDEEALHPPAEK